MAQAADRRQDGATSTPPSLPAPPWRRDFSRQPAPEELERLSPGTFTADDWAAPTDRRAEDRPPVVMVLAPLLGLGIWGAILVLLL